MSSENSKTCDLQNKEVINMLLYQALAFTIHGQIPKSHTKTILNISSDMQ